MMYFFVIVVNLDLDLVVLMICFFVIMVFRGLGFVVLLIYNFVYLFVVEVDEG